MNTNPNQCDGCMSGLQIDDHGMHRAESGHPVMICQRHKYEHEITNAVDPVLLEALEFIADIDISGADDRAIRFILVAAQGKASAAIRKAKGETK